MKLNSFCKFVSPNDLVSFSFQRGLGWTNWLKSDEGKKWMEDLKVKEDQFREICREQMSLPSMPVMYLR